MGSIVHRSAPTNLKWLPNCSHAHALFQDRFKDVQVGSRWFSTLYILSPNFHIAGNLPHAIPTPAMIQGYHAYSLSRSHNWFAGHFSPSRFVLRCVFWFVLLVCFCSLVLFCFSVFVL